MDLDEVVFGAVRPLRDVAPVILDTSGVSAALVHGDPDLLARIVGNLIGNAVRYASSRVCVGLAPAEPRASCT